MCFKEFQKYIYPNFIINIFYEFILYMTVLKCIFCDFSMLKTYIQLYEQKWDVLETIHMLLKSKARVPKASLVLKTHDSKLRFNIWSNCNAVLIDPSGISWASTSKLMWVYGPPVVRSLDSCESHDKNINITEHNYIFILFFKNFIN